MNRGRLFDGALERYVVRDVAVCAPEETAGAVRARIWSCSPGR